LRDRLAVRSRSGWAIGGHARVIHWPENTAGLLRGFDGESFSDLSSAAVRRRRGDVGFDGLGAICVRAIACSALAGLITGHRVLPIISVSRITMEFGIG